MTIGPKPTLPIPNFGLEPTEEISKKETSADLDLMVTAEAIKENISPPGSPKNRPSTKRRIGDFEFSPGNIASPNAPKPVNEYHYVDNFGDLSNRKVRKFKGKSRHTMVEPGSAKKQAEKLTDPDVYKYLSRASHRVAKGKPPAYKLKLDDLEITVPEEDKIVVTNPKKGTKRKFGIHRQPDGPNKSLYPIDGDGFYPTSKEDPSLPSPKDLLAIREKLKTSPESKVWEIFKQEYNLATPTKPSPLRNGEG